MGQYVVILEAARPVGRYWKLPGLMRQYGDIGERVETFDEATAE